MVNRLTAPWLCQVHVAEGGCCRGRVILGVMRDIRACAQCGKAFTPRREHARFCSPGCRVSWNREHVSSPSPGEGALDWAMAAMADTTARLLHASGWDRPSGFAMITEAVWWITMVDATLVRYQPDAYGHALASQDPAHRAVTEDTFGGLRFVRNRMGYEADHADFIQDRPRKSRASASRVAAWKWKTVSEPDLSSLTAAGQKWEMSRYQAYQAQLAGHPVGDTFSQAAAFLQLASGVSLQS